MYNSKMKIAIILALLNFVAISSCVLDPETVPTDPVEGLIISVGESSAPPGAENIFVTITLDNADPIKGLQMDVCDDGDYLTCTGCETTARSSDFECITNELEHGCCRLVLISLKGDSIDVGTGPLFSLSYDVDEDAPSECITLMPLGTKVSDENTSPLNPEEEQGEFCIE